MQFYKTPRDSEWKINLLKELTNLKMGSMSVNFDDNTKITAEEIDNIINHITTS